MGLRRGDSGALLFQRTERLGQRHRVRVGRGRRPLRLASCASALASVQPRQPVLRSLPGPDTLRRFSLHADALSCFFGLIVYAAGPSRTRFTSLDARVTEQHNVGVLAAFFNLPAARHDAWSSWRPRFILLIAWEMMRWPPTVWSASSTNTRKPQRGRALSSLCHTSAPAASSWGSCFCSKHPAAMASLAFMRSATNACRPAERRIPALPVRLRRQAGMVPVHIWLPVAHPVAPSNVSATSCPVCSSRPAFTADARPL